MKGVFRSIARASLAITGSRVLIKTISFGALLLITRVLTPYEFGLVSLALTVSGPVLVLSGLGLDDTVLTFATRRAASGDRAGANALLAGFAMVKLLLTAVAIIGLIVVRSSISTVYQGTLSTFFFPLLIWIALSSLRTLLDLGVQAKEWFGWFSAANVVEVLGKLVVVAVLFVGHGMTVGTVLWAYVIGKGISVLFVLPGARVFAPTTGVGAAVHAVLLLLRREGKWETARAFANRLLGGIDQWLIALLLGVEQVAVFSIALSMSSILGQALPFRQILLPILGRMSTERGSSAFVSRRIAKYSLWFYAPLLLGVALAAPLVVPIFFPKYAASVPIFLFLSLGHLLNSLSTSHGPLIYAHGGQRFLFFVGLLGTVSAVTALPLLTYVFGMFGTVLEQHLSTSAIIALRERWLWKHTGSRSFVLKDVFTLDGIDRMFMTRIWTGIRARLPL
ncbi:MAG: oligosaccharide flippase family protein [Patescibacteria group bacterium]